MTRRYDSDGDDAAAALREMSARQHGPAGAAPADQDRAIANAATDAALAAAARLLAALTTYRLTYRDRQKLQWVQGLIETAQRERAIAAARHGAG